MLQHDLLAPQGFKGTVLPILLSLADFEDYVLSEDMKRNSIQWDYFASKEIQHSKSIADI